MLVDFQFPLAPPKVARFFGGVTKTAKKRKKRQELGLIPTPFQKNHVRSIANEVDPQLLLKAMDLFRPCAFAVRAVADLAEDMVSCLYGKFSIHYKGEGRGSRVCLFLEGERSPVFTGGTAALFTYAAKFAPDALKLVLKHARCRYVKGPYDEDDLARVLEEYRLARKISKGTDNWTKVWQMTFYEEHLPVMKFKVKEASQYGAIHYGSGPVTGTSRFGIPNHEVICVDPLAKDTLGGGELYIGGTIKSNLPETFSDEDRYDIYSDASMGDQMGFTPLSDQQSIVDHFRLYSGDQSNVYVKLNISDPIEAVGRLHYKARPHNDEVIWHLDDTGEDFRTASIQIRKECVAANERRMQWFFGAVPRPRVRLKAPVGHGWVSRLIEKDFNIVPMPGPIQVVKKSRFKLFEQRLSGMHPSSRRAHWQKACLLSSKELKLELTSDYCLLPRKFLRTGFVFHLDPGVGSCEFSLLSVILSCLHYKRKISFGSEGWYIG